MVRREVFACDASARLAVLIVICLGHVALVAVLLSSSDLKRKRTRAASQDPLIVAFLDELRPQTQPAAPEAQAPSRPSADRQPPPLPPASAIAEMPSANTAPTLLPPTDWDAEVERAAAAALSRQADEEALHQFGTFPKGMGAPPAGRHEPGDSEPSVGGEVITWINDHCFVSNKSPTGEELGIPGWPKFIRSTCKKPRWDQDFETWKKQKSKLEEPERK